MPTPLPAHPSCFVRAFCGLVLASWLLFLPLTARADSIYHFTMTTSGLAGIEALFGFDLTNGDGTTSNSSVQISGFQTDGSFASTQAITLADANAWFNEATKAITFGSQLSFTLRFSTAFAPSSFFPDQFSLYLLDPSQPSSGTYGLHTGLTTSDTWGNALLLVDLPTDTVPSALVFDSLTPGVAWTLTAEAPTAVPEGNASLFGLFLFWSVSLCALRWQRRT